MLWALALRLWLRPPRLLTLSAVCRSRCRRRRSRWRSMASGCTSAVPAAASRTLGSMPAERFVTGLVLAAGGSSRLGRPKQLLPYGSGTLLEHVLGIARECAFDQLVCVVGGAGREVLAGVDFSGVEVVENPAFGEGC